MKTLITICLTMFLVFGFSSALVAQEIPGGIVYLEAGSIVYHDFATGQKTNLTADLKTVVNKLVVISNDGKSLLWASQGKLWARTLPDGDPWQDKWEVHKQTGTFYVSSEGNKRVEINVEKEIKNPTLSSSGLAFEYQAIGDKFVEVGPGKKVYLETIDAQNNVNIHPENQFPKYTVVKDKYQAVAVRNIVLGNSACYPPTCLYRLAPEPTQDIINKVRRSGGYIGTPTSFYCSGAFTSNGKIAGIEGNTHKKSHERLSIKREAYYPAWAIEEGKRLLAVIFKTEKGWGPIRIQDSSNGWEIPISLKSCDGLAWKPDGSLTYLTESRVFNLDGALIKEEITKRGNDPEKDEFSIEPREVASGITGNKIYWVSNDGFIFQGNDGALYLWNNGEIKKILSDAPKDFSYCRRSPVVPVVLVGTERADVGTERVDEGGFSIGGSIKTSWSGHSTKKVYIHIGSFKTNIQENPPQIQPPIQFAFPDETNLKDIQDPSQYEYKSEYWFSPSDGLPLGKTNLATLVPINQIVLLKSGNKYAAIKPVAIEHKYKSVDEMPASLRSSWTEYKDKGPLPIFGWMTYEWKYWPAGTVSAISKAKETKPISVLPSTSGKAEAIEKQDWFWPGRLAPPDFYIQMESIKTTWEEHTYPPYRKKGVHIIVGASAREKGTERVEFVPMEYTFPEKPPEKPPEQLEQIGNPAVYEYKQGLYKPGQPGINPHHVNFVYFNQIIILKVGNEYLAIKPIAVKQKYKSLEEVPELLRNQLLTDFPSLQRDPSKFSGLSLEYEWKYWPGVPSGTPAQEAPAQTAPAQVAGPVNQIQK